MRSILGLSLLPLLAAGSPVIVETIHNEAAPVVSSTNAKHVPDSYIVVFKKHITEHAAASHHSWVQDIHLQGESARTELKKRGQFSFQDMIYNGLKHTYDMPGLLGYSGHFHEDVIEQIRRHPDVSSLHTSEHSNKFREALSCHLESSIGILR